MSGLLVDTDVSLFGETATAEYSPDRVYRYALIVLRGGRG